jgi:glyceraldehyde-3-phosphate dehydrogenase (NAD(P))
MASKTVHVVGTGTIGEPIIGLLAKHRTELGIDEVTFYKHSPRKEDRPMVNALRKAGAKLAVADDKRADFEKIGLAPDFSAQAALERAQVVIDCTPEDSGLENKDKIYSKLTGDKLFMAQGSEEGFGAMYALGINDHKVDPAKEKYVHVVSCNTHTTVRLVHALTKDGDDLEEGRLVLIRRAGDVGDAKFIQAPTVEKHKEARGTHHAQDAANLYKTTLGKDVNLFSSAMKLNTQFMHTAHFHFRLKTPTTLDGVKKLLQGDKFIGLTEKAATNLVFSFAREHGPFGRILSQTVVVTPSLHVSENGRDLTGYAFTPQDGNALLSSIAMATRKLHPDDWQKRMSVFDPYLLKEY